MKVLELFAGSRSVGKVAERLGLEVWSVDINGFEGINEVVDILNFNPSTTGMPFIPDFIWLSPPCTSYSIAACSHHRNLDKSAKTETAKIGDMLVLKSLSIINHYQILNQKIIWFMENPRGLLRKMSFMQDIPRHTVTYCAYGDKRMKPTDIWTNSKLWVPKDMCSNGDKCHESAPRGSKTGTQGIRGAYERSKIPERLCLEILIAAMIESRGNSKIKQLPQLSLFNAA